MTSAPIIQFGGQQLSWALGQNLLSVKVERGLRRVATAEITLKDPGFTLLTDQASQFAPGTDVVVSFPNASGSPVKVFAGTVTSLRVVCPEDGDHHTAITITAEDAAHGLGHVAKTISTANTSLTDALRTALSAHVSSVKLAGLPAGTRDAVIMACSPQELLEQVCDHYGLTWWVDPADKSLNVAAPPTSPAVHALELGADLCDLDFRTAGKTTGSVIMRGWNPLTKTELNGRNTAAAATAGGPALLNEFAQADSAKEYHVQAKSSVDAADVTAQATARARRFATAGTVLTARTRRIQPGIGLRDQLQLNGAGPMSGKHLVVAIRHDWGPVTATTVVAGDPALGAAPIPDSGPVQAVAPAQPLSQTVGGSTGMVPGLISDIKDPKNWGRVKVKLPTLGENVITGWARTVLTAAGPSRGMVVPHRVDDEVLVAFEEGDLQRPVVLGALHNGKDTAPTGTAPRDAALSAGLTSGNGHSLVLTDTTDQAKNGMVLNQAGGQSISLNDQRILIKAAAGKEIRLEAGKASITLDAQGNVKIEGVQISVTATSKMDLNAPAVTTKATANLTLEGTASCALKGASVNVTANGVAAIKGSMVTVN
ncbi:phage baseplate assembly protein V [Kineosporia babensis]|uniref:Phage baseplate assembly protein V n=1 Tax=Kineosporia babensis TaxID=499548 RepID=A0A9X1NBV4_9ACTN|nr:phage baseplate assembly protein V [Kineosporia babensis]MCD5310431.1 phage baseplate assembly protein V [Kineosporia babensis]